MEFGAVADPTGIDFSLPPVDTRCVARWPVGTGTLTVRTGAPMWAEKSWTGPFYPESLPSRGWLAHYAERLTTVEHNGTFYAVPKSEQLAAWAATTPADFRFITKVPRSISHAGPWREDAARFASSVAGFGDRLGLLLFQVPPEIGPEHLPEIAARVDALGPDLPVAVEVRHPGFFPNRRLAAPLLTWMDRTRRIAVVTDTPGHREVAHLSLPSPVLYLRFLATRGHPVDQARVADWADHIAGLAAQGLREAWIVVHQADVTGLLTALETFHRELDVRLGTRLPHTLLRPKGPALFR